MAPISLKDNRIQDIAEDFVEQLTGFKRASRNFNLSVQFAVSNFRYHRYLDVDGFKVSHALEGVEQKFVVHSQSEKATAFHDLCEKFLSNPLSDTEENVKTDSHFSLLLLLLQLSDSPTHTEYKPPEKLEELNDEDDFDWKAYLLGDAEEEIIGLPQEDSNVIWSDDEETKDEFDAASDLGMGSSTPADAQELTLRNATLVHHVTSSPEKGKSWLLEQITSQYWEDYSPNAYEDIANVTLGHCSLSIVWESHQCSQNPFAQTTARQLTETQLVRETLWMLSGVNSSYVYSIHGNKVDVNGNLKVSHLSKESLAILLTKFAAVGAKTHELLSFVGEILSDTGTTRQSDVKPTQTAQAFAATLSNYIKDYKKCLTKLQKDIIDKKCPVTLVNLHDTLKQHHEEIFFLYDIYHEGMASSGNFSPSQQTCHLLDVFYSTMCSFDATGACARPKVALLLCLFLDTLRPCMDFINYWVTSGEMQDPHSEFFIQKNASMSVESTAFWEKGVTLRSEMSSQGSPNMVPCFLEDHIKQILVAGKSVSLIQELGKMAEMFGTRNVGSMYEDFVASLTDAILKRSMSHSEESNHDRKQDSQSETDPLDLVSGRAVLSTTRDIGDPILRMALLVSMDTPVQVSNRSNRFSDKKRQSLCSGIESVLVPVDLLFKTCLAPLVQTKYTEACGALIRLLKSEYDLTRHLAAMRNFFLLEAGDTMQHFYCDIFKKICRHQPWQDTSNLNSLLQEALRDKYPDAVERVAVNVLPNTSGFKGSVVHCLQGMTLHYKVPWPVSVVIDEACQRKYNQVLLFLLTLKRAKWSLDKLRFTDLTGEARRRRVNSDEDDDEDDDNEPHSSIGQIDRSLVHRIHLLRFRLLHFVNSLHNYIMTRILYTTGLEFQDDLAKAKDFDDVIAVHAGYVSKVFERCLLNEKVGFVKEAITKVLNVALNFQSMWDTGVKGISDSRQSRIETEFSKCNHFVVTFLHNLVKRGAFPHLEALAYSLSGETGDAVN